MEEPHPHNIVELKNLPPHITLADLKNFWIGLGAALEWIAVRGQEIPESEYGERYDNAAEALVSALADMPPEIAESLVRGHPASEPDSPLGAVPAGIWSQTDGRERSTKDKPEKPYFLVGVDDAEEWEGAVWGLNGGYRRLQVRSSFLLDYWPPDHPTTEPKKQRNRFSVAQIRRLIETIIADTPPSLAPLTNAEITIIARKSMPDAPRDVVRKILRETRPQPKPGPRGPRKPDRAERIREFGEKILAAKLRN